MHSIIVVVKQALPEVWAEALQLEPKSGLVLVLTVIMVVAGGREQEQELESSQAD